MNCSYNQLCVVGRGEPGMAGWVGQEVIEHLCRRERERKVS